MTKTFKDLEFSPHIADPDGIQAIITFENGYSASVIKNSFSYGGNSGRYELAVLHGGLLVYDTPITDDVLGWLDEDAVTQALQAISELPVREERKEDT